MKKIVFLFITLLGLSFPLLAQTTVKDCVTSGNEGYSIINISRSNTYQEVRGAGKLIQQLYINDQPVCEITNQSRVSIKVYSEGKLNITIKYLPNGKIKQKVIDKQFLSGNPLEIEVVRGRTYFANVDTKVKEGALLVFFTAQIVAITESESMFRDESRFEKSPDIKVYQEDINNPFIKK